MKQILPILTIAAALAVMSTPVIAQDGSYEEPDATKPLADAEADKGHPDVSKIPKQRRASKLIGIDVHNFDKEKIGEIHDLIIAPSGNRIIAAIITSGGFLGLNNELSILPPPTLKYDEKEEVYKIQIKKDQLADAPHFNDSEWPNLADHDLMTKVYNSYQIEPIYSTAMRKDIPSGDMSNQVARASKLLGMKVVDQSNESVGDVKEILVNQDLNRVTSVVISSGGFLGLGDTLSAVPADVLNLTDKGQLRIDVTKEILTKSPRLTEEDWDRETSDNSFFERIYAPFRLDSGDQDPDQPNSMDQANDKRSRELTRQIRRKVIERDDLSFSAKNIQIITAGEEIALTGQVNSEEEKSIIIDIVKKTSDGNYKVTNRLTVKTNNQP